MLVAGRIVNCYSVNDWVLKFLFRTTASLKVENVAGLSPIESVDGVENVNMSSFVFGHLEYAEKVAAILEMLNL
jgi:hypothetical protein